MTLSFVDTATKVFDSIGNLFVTILSFAKSFILFGQEGFLNLLDFLNYFLFDFIFDSLTLFDFLPPVFNFGFSILFFYMVVMFILKLLKQLPFL